MSSNGTDFYKIQLREGPSERLVVLFSSHPGHPFKSIDFRATVLSIADQNLTYFCQRSDIIISAIDKVLSDSNYQEVIFIGASKGGFGAIKQSQLLAKRNNRKIHCIVFSPQTKVYPPNSALRFPSYRKMIESSQFNPELLKALQELGCAESANDPLVPILCAYSARNDTDKIEALRIKGDYIRYIPIDMAFHFCILPFICDTSNAESIQAAVIHLFGRAPGQIDLSELMRPDAILQLIEELKSVGKYPQLTELIDDFVRDYQ